jgi:hypothetical protein
LGAKGLMNHKTDDNLITVALVRKASDFDDLFVGKSQPKDLVYSSKNKRFFLFNKRQGDRLQSEVTALKTSFAPLED